ncbi:ADP-forming succinate--CoA ligase subunit beta [Myxococcota bacterium]|nr:ADP-forming succinate--CoA ligase subunit beta [Myxococcota bacterium]
MKIHEYQAKALLKKYGVPVPNGQVAFSVEEATAVAKQLGVGDKKVVVKAQIHAGGRGKGGGVKLAGTLDEAIAHSKAILGMTLITHQTGPQGQLVKRLLIEDGCNIQHEYYFGMVLDRETSRVTIMASTEGGMDIEEVAAKTPEKILKAQIDPATGVGDYQINQLFFDLGLPKSAAKDFRNVVLGCYNAYVQEDASLFEINPLVLTKEGGLLALDGKINFDDNAGFRHPEWAELRDLDEEEPTEIQAAKFELSYVKLDGNIGCLVNGAGLAMSTMDIIKHHGGEPANFLDVGGSASQEAVTEGFKIILSDPHVKGILVNIFGGIMKCDVIAAAVIAAAKQIQMTVPLVVRLEGTNVDLGKSMLNDSGLAIVSADDLNDAAQKIVKAIGA